MQRSESESESGRRNVLLTCVGARGARERESDLQAQFAPEILAPHLLLLPIIIVQGFSGREAFCLSREEGERERALQDHSLPSGSGTRNHRRMSAACAAAAARPALMLVCRSCRLPSSCARESTGRHADARQTCVLRESHVEGRRPSTPAPALAHTPSRVSLCVHRVILASLLAAQLVTHFH